MRGVSGYQVLSRRRGRGELRKFVLDVVAFEPKVLSFIKESRYIVAITNLGLYLWGGRDYVRPLPSQVSAPVGIEALGADIYTVWAVDANGRLWKRLNHGCIVPFKQYGTPTPVKSIHTDLGYGNHTVYIATNGDLYGMGYNSGSGGAPLGLGPDVGYVEEFAKLPVGKPLKSAFCLYDHVVGITTEGELYVAGGNKYPVEGCLGLGSADGAYTFTYVPLIHNGVEYKAKQGVISSYGTGVVTEDGSLFTSGWLGNTFEKIPISGVVQVAMGEWTSYGTPIVALFEDGTVWGVGADGSKMVSHTPPDTFIIQISGDHHYGMIMLDSLGRLWKTDIWSGAQLLPLLPPGQDSCEEIPE